MPRYNRHETYILTGAVEIPQHHLKWQQTCGKASEGDELSLDLEMCESGFVYTICQSSHVRQKMDIGSRVDWKENYPLPHRLMIKLSPAQSGTLKLYFHAFGYKEMYAFTRQRC